MASKEKGKKEEKEEGRPFKSSKNQESSGKMESQVH